MAHSSRHKPRHHRMHRPLKPRGPWANGPVPVIGIVGGIGAGKSLATATLAEIGLHRLDADAVGHALLTQRPAREAVVERFGTAILLPVEPNTPTEDGAEIEPVIDRRALGRVVFNDPNARRDLEAIMHPSMRKTFERAIARAGRSALPGVVLDAAVLFEAGWNNLCDAVLFIDAPPELRLARVTAERGWTAEDLAVREGAQSSLESKRGRADHILINEGTAESFRDRVLAWWKDFQPKPTTGPRTRSRPRSGPGPGTPPPGR